MRVGINGMGRIGRLALRAALGGMPRAGRRPARGQSARHRACQRTERRRRGDRASAGVRQHPWPLAWLVRRRGRQGDHRSTTSASASATQPRPATSPWGDLGCDIVLECTGKFLKPEQLRGLLRPRREARDRRGAGEGRGALNIVVGVNDDLYDPSTPPAADGGVVHHQLPRAGGQGRARGDRHPARPDHHHPRSDQHQCRRRCAAQGSAARALGDAVAAAHHHRQRDRDRADLSGAEGQAERPCGARAGAEREPDRLRVRAEARRPRRRRSTSCSRAAAAGRSPASSASSRARWSRPTTTTTRAARSSMGRAPW